MSTITTTAGAATQSLAVGQSHLPISNTSSSTIITLRQHGVKSSSNSEEEESEEFFLAQDDEEETAFLNEEAVDKKKWADYYNISNWAKVEPQVYRHKPKSIRRFYKQQNMLIDRLRAFYNTGPEKTPGGGGGNVKDVDDDDEEERPSHPAIERAIYLSFGLNVLLLAIKILASILSGSMSVIASAADSLLDLLSGSVLVVTHRLIQHKSTDTFRYPQGKSRMEPIGVFSFAIIMMLSSVQIIIEAIRRLVDAPEIVLGPVTLAILAFTIGSKAVASVYCRQVAQRYQSIAAAAYADDHRNDVLTNMVAVGAALAAVYVPTLWFLDSTGAILIAIYIIVNWINTGYEQLHFLTGRGAPPMLLQQLTYIAANHDERIKFVDTVRAYHFGVNYLVEVDIVLPENMPLCESHDIGESLQHRLEQFEDVERAFVHNDFEWNHDPVVFRGTRIIRK